MIKILSIDGGGIRGIIPSIILSEIENRLKKPIAECFDLISGTSTGGILGLGIVKQKDGKPQYSCENLVDIYMEHGKDIFSRNLFYRFSSCFGLFSSEYQVNGLNRVLTKYFGDDQLKDAFTKIMVTTYDIKNREPFFIKSWNNPEILMKHAARATSAAPTYFEPFEMKTNGLNRTLVDGGIFINSPSVSAFAAGMKSFPNQEYFLLSIGCGELTRSIAYNRARKWGKAMWLAPLLGCMFDGMSDAANYQMLSFLSENYYRLQVKLDFASDDLDDISYENMENLKKEARLLIKQNSKSLDSICEILGEK